MKTKNVFIATLPRSGSTLFGMILGAHSQMCHIGESAYWSKMDVNTSKCCCGVIGCKKLIEMHDIISLYPKEVLGVCGACGMIDCMEEPNKIRHNLSHSYNGCNQKSFTEAINLCCSGLDKISDAARVVFGNEIVVDNSKYIRIAENLLSCSSDWKILIITRDPRGIALSGKESGQRKGVNRPVHDKVNLLISFARLSAEIASKENVLLIRYEDLCADAFGTAVRVCDFLGVEFESRMLEFKFNKGHFLMGNRMMHDQNQVIREDVRWRELLTQEEKQIFMQYDLLEAYGKIGYNLAV